MGTNQGHSQPGTGGDHTHLAVQLSRLVISGSRKGGESHGDLARRHGAKLPWKPNCHQRSQQSLVMEVRFPARKVLRTARHGNA